MFQHTGWMAAISIVLLGLSPFAQAGVDFRQIGNSNYKYSGDGTYYGQQPGQNDNAACSFGRNGANALGLEWSRSVQTFIALNQAQFNQSEACGQCIMYRGLGDSPKCKSPIGEKTCGTTPIQSEWKMGLVDNLCPECSYGDIDLNLDGNGRWLVEWYAVPCDVADGKFHYTITGQNPYWFMLVVSNTRVPVKRVEVPGGDGVYYPMRRGFNNAWAANGGPFNFPIKLRITSVLDDVVEDYLQSGGNIGAVQFPLRPAATAAPTATPQPAKPVLQAAVGAVKAALSYGPLRSIAGPLTTAFSGPEDGTPGAAPQAAPAGAPAESAGAPAFQQAQAPADAPPAEAPAAASQAGQATNGTESVLLTPAPAPSQGVAVTAVQGAPVEAGLQPERALPRVPPGGVGSSPGSPPVPSGPKVAQRYVSFQVVKGGQCGGTRGFCTDLGENQCKDGQWDGASCQPGTTCLRYDATWWECKPADVSVAGRRLLRDA